MGFLRLWQIIYLIILLCTENENVLPIKKTKLCTENENVLPIKQSFVQNVKKTNFVKKPKSLVKKKTDKLCQKRQKNKMTIAVFKSVKNLSLSFVW